MNNMNERIKKLENNVKDLKNELRRIKTTINKLEKLGLTTPPEILFIKEDKETILKEYKQELKALKKVVEIIK